jgi:hypothetical protein
LLELVLSEKDLPGIWYVITRENLSPLANPRAREIEPIVAGTLARGSIAVKRLKPANSADNPHSAV